MVLCMPLGKFPALAPGDQHACAFWKGARVAAT